VKDVPLEGNDTCFKAFVIGTPHASTSYFNSIIFIFCILFQYFNKDGLILWETVEWNYGRTKTVLIQNHTSDTGTCFLQQKWYYAYSKKYIVDKSALSLIYLVNSILKHPPGKFNGRSE
jgi:hypothetical protein